MIVVERVEPRRWIDIISNSEVDPEDFFLGFTSILNELDMTRDDAIQLFTIRYENMISSYSEFTIRFIILSTAKTNAKKYEQLLAMYNAEFDFINNYWETRSYTDTRTPNLQVSSTNSGSGTQSTTRNQISTTTTTPNVNGISTRYIDPYDGSGFRQESKTETSDSGTTSTQISYAGSPDQVTNSSTGSGSVTTTGNEKIVHAENKQGANGKYLPGEIVDSAEQAAARLNIFNVICEDIADQIFLQVWE